MNSLIVFIIASLLLAVVPGPDNLFVLMQSTLYGKRSGIVITLGLCTGLIVHTGLVVLGVAALLQTVDGAFVVLKVIGACYLLYLAWQIARTPVQNEVGEGIVLSDKALYLRGIIMNVTNPKVTIFFLAFLPQFTHPDLGPVAPQLFMLGVIFGLITLLVFCAIAGVAAQLGEWLTHHPGTLVYLGRGSALVLVLLACNLLFTSMVPGV